MTDTNRPRSRQPQGTPVGGQFATEVRPCATVVLTDAQDGPAPDAELAPYSLADLQILGYPGGEWNGLPQPWLTEQSMHLLAAQTARQREIDGDFALVFCDAETGEWMVDEGAGWEGDGRTHPVVSAKGPGYQDVHQLQGWDFDELEPWTEDELADEVDEALPHYLDAAKFTTYLTDERGEEIGPADTKEFDPGAVRAMRGDLEDFYQSNQHLIRALRTIDPERGTAEYVAHDFWLTRNHHGAGFWDRGNGEIGDLLTTAAAGHGGKDIELGDDGRLHAL